MSRTEGLLLLLTCAALCWLAVKLRNFDPEIERLQRALHTAKCREQIIKRQRDDALATVKEAYEAACGWKATAELNENTAATWKEAHALMSHAYELEKEAAANAVHHAAETERLLTVITPGDIPQVDR